MTCSICSHPKRQAIEEALLSRNWSEGVTTFSSIAKEFNVEVRALQVHSVMHFTKVEPDDNTPSSISDKIKLREADLLVATANEYFATLKNLGVKINAIVSNPAPATALTTPMVDLYLGTGRNIRDLTEAMIKLNVAINGEENKGLESLGNLVLAVKRSKAEEDD